ncbi:MAG: hypothetical protein RR506_09700 [Akkermansia sp.]
MKKSSFKIIASLALLTACFFSPLLADSPDSLLPTSAQIAFFREGKLDALQDYMGEQNTVLLVCIYQKTWTDPVPPSLKATLTSYATVVQSTDKSFPVGKKVEWINFFENTDGLSPEKINNFKKVDGRLIYLFNPCPDQEKSTRETAFLYEPFYFYMDQESGYKNLRAHFDINPRTKR